MEKYVIHIEDVISEFSPVLKLWLNNGLSKYSYRLAAFVILQITENSNDNFPITIAPMEFNTEYYKNDLVNISNRVNVAIDEIKAFYCGSESCYIDFDIRKTGRTKNILVNSYSNQYSEISLDNKSILKNILGLKSLSATRLYLLINHILECSEKKLGFYSFHMDEILSYLAQSNQSKYQNRFTDICRRLLDPSIVQINEVTNIQLTLDQMHGDFCREKKGMVGLFAYKT